MRVSVITITVLTFVLVRGNVLETAKPCYDEKCKLPNCKCSTTDSKSGIPIAKIPQIVMLTFDDAVTQLTYDFFVDALFNRKNPDGCPIGATHFVTHEYTEYDKVHRLWKDGHEIALHSVTHSTSQNYWKEIDNSTMKAEFGDMRKILGNFAAIPESDIRGIRLPFLQIGGNVTPAATQSLGLLYDSSMPTHLMDPALWPYTFDYQSIQECAIPPCAEASFPGVWEVPMINWRDQKNVVCSMVDACVNVPHTEEPLFQWILEQFHRHYNGSRAPFPVFMHAAWFIRSPENFKAYKRFVEHVEFLPDVYVVTVKKAIEWIKNPKPITAKKPFGECETRVPKKPCRPLTCQLTSPTGGDRWMTSCATICPKNYPWLGNPLGN